MFHVKHLTHHWFRARTGPQPAPTPLREPEDMSRILAIANQKGGVGKTTTAVNLAASLAVAEQRTLLIDLDPQGNATSAYGLDKAAMKTHVYHALVDGVPLAETLVPTELPFLTLCPTGTDLAGAEVELVAMEAREHRLQPVSYTHLTLPTNREV